MSDQHPTSTDDCRGDWQMFLAQVQAREEQDAPSQEDHGDKTPGKHTKHKCICTEHDWIADATIRRDDESQQR